MCHLIPHKRGLSFKVASIYMCLSNFKILLIKQSFIIYLLKCPILTERWLEVSDLTVTGYLYELGNMTYHS